ncbi:hypothetical protein KJS94_04215 [Flavihumibacter rivuli]|uniref:hypothetical protein n=1 Tax=Flavihumibacter rivuli TaxID=2838156 RepID=UPI001BDDED6D|nr:hypothetical protein [Flavihumibacter rivuli]ULQ57405.1 hypothetical protein KJS94_04215 [Flavihumibacter rivuli]
MEKAYRQLPYFILGLFAILTWGFFRTYLILFPEFKGIKYIYHIHGFLMMTWLGMLFIQPILIARQKPALHRQIGRLSYIVMPLLLLSIFFVGKDSYFKLLGTAPAPEAIGSLALNIPNLLAFALFYGLAMYHRQNSAYHMRFMIGTALLMIGPGLGRALILYFNVPFPLAVTYVTIFSLLIAIVLLVLDFRNKRTTFPFTIISATIAMILIIWQFRASSAWQGIGSWIASTLY